MSYNDQTSGEIVVEQFQRLPRIKADILQAGILTDSQFESFMNVPAHIFDETGHERELETLESNMQFLSRKFQENKYQLKPQNWETLDSVITNVYAEVQYALQGYQQFTGPDFDNIIGNLGINTQGRTDDPDSPKK